MTALVAGGLVALLGVGAGVSTYHLTKKEKASPPSISTKYKRDNSVPDSRGSIVHNKFRQPIKVRFYERGMKSFDVLLGKGEARPVKHDAIALEIYLLTKRGEQRIGLYEIVKPMKNIFLGQFTTRILGEETSVLATSAVSRLQGIASINIHNLTKIPLRLNENIIVPAESTFVYRGRYNTGVPFGLILRDSSEFPLYEDYQLLEPQTDLYYGLASDVEQLKNGGYQTEGFWPEDAGWPIYFGQFGYQ